MLKRFLLKEDNGSEGPWPIIQYDDSTKEWNIIVPKNTPMENVPLIPRIYCFEKGENPVSHEHTLMFIKERIPPAARQNIDIILRDIGMKYYNEYELLVAYQAKSTQDDFYIEIKKENI